MDIWLSIASIVFGIFVYIYSERYAIFTLDQVGGSGFPRILAVIIIICGILIGVQYLRTSKTNDRSKKKQGDSKVVAIVLIVIALYTILIEKIGYSLLTFLFLISMLILQKFSDIKRTTGWAVVITAVLYLSFGVILKVKLPKGILF